jgi:hypothetical protein
LLNSDPLEEILQRFIEHNPILLHRFPAQQLFFKPSILSRFNADFAIVTPEKELVLIEIERASTRLLRSNGGQHEVGRKRLRSISMYEPSAVAGLRNSLRNAPLARSRIELFAGDWCFAFKIV